MVHYQQTRCEAVVLEERLRRAAPRERRCVDPDASSIGSPTHDLANHRLGYSHLARIGLHVHKFNRGYGLPSLPVAEHRCEPDAHLVEQSDDQQPITVRLNRFQLRRQVLPGEAPCEKEPAALPVEFGYSLIPQIGDESQVGGIRLPGVLHRRNSAFQLADPGEDGAPAAVGRFVFSDRGELLLGEAGKSLHDL